MMLEHIKPAPTHVGRFGRRVILPVAALVGGAIFLVLGVVTFTSARQDALALDASTRLAQTALSVKQHEIGRNLKDYAVWEDAYKNLSLQLDLDWAATDGNVGANVYNSLGYDMAFVVTPDGRTVYAVLEGKPRKEGVDAFALIPNGLDGLVRQAREAPVLHARHGHRRPARWRRVRDRPGQSRHAGRRTEPLPPARRVPAGVVHDRGPRALRRRQHRRRARPGGRPRPRAAAEERRHRALPGEAGRARDLPLLRAADGLGAAGQEGARAGPAAGARARPARAALPAARLGARSRADRGGGADALAPPRARRHRARRVHSRRRGDRAHHPARRVGAADRLRTGAEGV